MTEVPAELQTEIDKLERKHAENPDGRFFVPLANAYRRAGDGDAAERLLRAGVARHPGYLSARIVLGRCLADRGAIAEAEDEFRYVVSEDPQNVVALRTLAELALQEGHIDEALGWYHELLAVDPQNEEARRALDELQAAETPADTTPTGTDSARTRDHDGREGDAPVMMEEGTAAVHALIDDDPEVPLEVVTETIAELYARQGLHDRAAAVYRELIRRRGDEPELQNRLRALELAAGAAADGERPPKPDAPPAPLEPAAPAPESDPAPVYEASADDGILALEDEEALLTPALDSEVDPFADSFADGFPLPEEPEEATVSIVGFLSRLATWTPTGRTPEPAANAAPREEPSTAPAPGPVDAPSDLLSDAAETADAEEGEGEGYLSGTSSADDELFPWELPVDDVDTPPESSSVTEAAGGEPFQGENDDDFESFQDWLRSLKR